MHYRARVAHHSRKIEANGTTQWNPARADVRYTPQPDGSLPGTMHTEISSGACQGTVDMNMTAEPA